MGIDDLTAVTAVRRDWAGDEAALPGGWAELRRLVGRARRRWLRTLVWALVCAAVVVAVAARRPRRWQSRAVLRVDAAAVVPGEAGRAVLSDAQLGAAIAAHQLYPRARDRARAIAQMRADLDVSVDGDALAITLHGDDAERVYQTVRDLSQIVSDEQDWPMLDPGRVDSGLDRATLLALVGAVAFVLALPLCGLGVGAFDRRIYELDDVRRLGMPTLGAVRSFDGDNTGALVSRLARDRRDRIGPS